MTTPVFRKSPFICAAALLMLFAALPARADKTLVAVIKSRDIPQYTAALKGFITALLSRRPDVTFAYFDMNGDKGKSPMVTAQVKAAAPALVFTIGSLATETARDGLPDLPTVFAMVLNPTAGGLVKSMASSGNTLTGASLDIPVQTQFEAMKTVVPGLKRVGVLYNPQESTPLIKEAAGTAAGMGLEIVAREVAAEGDVPVTLEGMIRDVDCLWSISDSTVFSSFKSIQFIILSTLRNNKPFMGLSSSFVRSGALFAVSCDIEDNGVQAGEIADRVLGGTPPAEIPIAVPRKTTLSINLRIAKEIGVVIPKTAVDAAAEVFR